SSFDLISAIATSVCGSFSAAAASCVSPRLHRNRSLYRLLRLSRAEAFRARHHWGPDSEWTTLRLHEDREPSPAAQAARYRMNEVRGHCMYRAACVALNTEAHDLVRGEG